MNQWNFNRRVKLAKLFLLLLILLLGALYIRYTYITTEEKTTDSALKIARTAKLSFPIDNLKNLNAVSSDIDKPEYRIVKNLLIDVVKANPSARFAYIFVRKGDKLFFLADSEPETSPDYSPPGQEYTEATYEDKKPFEDGKEYITSTLTDRWGSWKSVLIPIKDEKTDNTIALLGMDYNAQMWENEFFYHILIAVVIVIAFLVVFYFSVKIFDKNLALKKEVSFRIEAEKLLKQTRINYVTFFNTVDEFLFVLDENRNIIYYNNTVASRLEFVKNELIGCSILKIFAEDQRVNVSKIISNILCGITDFCHIPIVTKSGHSIAVETRLSYGIWDDKLVIFVVTKDVSQIKLSEEKFSKAFYLNPSACSLSNLETGKYIEVNNAFYTLLGFNKNEVIGKTVIELGVLTPDLIKNILQKDDGTGRIIDAEVTLRAKNGNVKHVLLSAENIILQDKKLRYTIVHDITKQKENEARLALYNEELEFSKKMLEESLFQKNALVEELTETKDKLEKLNSEKDKLFSVIAHDLKSPFQGFISITEAMAEDINSFSKEELRHLSIGMHSNAKNLYRLLRNLLDWALMQQGQVNFSPVEIDLAEIIGQNVELVIRRSEQKGITITIANQDNFTVFADEAMLNSIIRNLLSNAVKFTSNGGKIIVETHEIENNMVLVSVADSGIGIPEDMLNKLFRVEEKVGRKGTDGEDSTGLGLTLCREFVEKQGGKIWVNSQENIGTTFYFTLKSANVNN